MFLVCGEALCDMFLREGEGAALRVDAYRGGSPYNVAIGLARLGSQASFFGGFSNDPLGSALRSALQNEGVDTRLSPTKKAVTTLSLVQLDNAGSPHYAFYGVGAADRILEPADIPALPPEITALHFGSFSLVVEPCGGTLFELASAQAGKCLISYDPNVRPTVEADMSVWRGNVGEWLRIADIVKVSQEDLMLLYPDQDPLEVASGWLKLHPALVVVTQSAAGAVAFSSAGETRIPAPMVDVVDAVGAGDSFQAALLHGLEKAGLLSQEGIRGLTSQALSSIMRLAVAAGALTCSRAGADLPRIAELTI